MKNETPTQSARRICPNWMSPTGDAHYRDVLKALQNQCDKAERIALDYAANNSTGDMGVIAAKTIALAIRSAALSNDKLCGLRGDEKGTQ